MHRRIAREPPRAKSFRILDVACRRCGNQTSRATARFPRLALRRDLASSGKLLIFLVDRCLTEVYTLLLTWELLIPRDGTKRLSELPDSVVFRAREAMLPPVPPEKLVRALSGMERIDLARLEIVCAPTSLRKRREGSNWPFPFRGCVRSETLPGRLTMLATPAKVFPLCKQLTARDR